MEMDDSGKRFVAGLRERFAASEASRTESVDAPAEMLEDPTGITVLECRPEDLDEETLNSFMRFKESYDMHQDRLKETARLEKRTGDGSAFDTVRVKSLGSV